MEGAFTGNIVAGLVAASIYALAVFLFQTAWKTHCEPWFENKVYQDAQIEGQWEISYEVGVIRKELVTLKRRAHGVTGEIVGIEGPDIGKTYQLSGIFKNLLLTASYSSTDKKSLDRGTFTLQLANNGGSLEGSSSYYDDDTHKITSDECIWSRKQ